MQQISSILEKFGTESRIWVYVGNRQLTPNEQTIATEEIINFANNWQTHGKEMTATGFLFAKQALVLVANESELKASGCSIDKINHFIKALGAQFNINFFDRMTTLVLDQDQWIASAFNPNETRPVISAATQDISDFLI